MKILDPYYRINHVSGVSIYVHKEGKIDVNICELTARGKQLDIVKKISDIKSTEELKKHFLPKYAVALNLTGKGVLTRQIESLEEINQVNFSKILPNGNVNDFYIQNFISGNFSFISIIRKSEADGWIKLLKEAGLILLSLSLGPFPVDNILSQLNVYGEDIQFNGHVIRRDQNSNWIRYKFEDDALTPFALKIEFEVLNEKLIIPYAIAFQTIIAESLNVIQADIPGLRDTFRDRLTNNKLKVNGFAVLTAFFLFLLMNYMVFSWLNSANEKLSLQVNGINQSSKDINVISDQIKKKEFLLQELGWDGSINKGYLVDQLSALMPIEITLREIAIDPIDLNGGRVRKTLKFYDRKIAVVGTSDKIIPVNEWMARIKAQKWVKNVQLESYSFNSELNTGQFNIEIDY